ncbi:DUF2842 domain-containing protein [Desertibaculum subflavum]|uniref:DUF2842 domain-containing protein n=1 Tax=Desertibaculum subflavum TaxID=2268458 RepID=UPI0034D2C624
MRKLFGLVVLLAGLVVYALLAMRLAVAVLPDDLIVQTLYYIAAGVVWIVPAVPFVRWVQRGRPS